MREVKYYLQLLLRQVLSLLDYSQRVYVDKSSRKLRRQIESQSQQESPLALMSANSSFLWQEMINEIFLNDRPGWCFENSRFFWSFVKFALRSQFVRDVAIISVISQFASSDPCKLFFLSSEHSPQTTISKGSVFQCRSGDFIGDWAWQERLPLSNVVSIFGKISLAGFSEEEITWHLTHPTYVLIVRWWQIVLAPILAPVWKNGPLPAAKVCQTGQFDGSKILICQLQLSKKKSPFHYQRC